MARRRVNWNFVRIAAAVPLVAAVAAAAWYKLRPKDPNKFIAAGDQYQRQGDLPDAVAAYGFAAGLRPTDAGLHLKLAKLYYSMKDQGPANFESAVNEWTTAEELQPDLKEAWQGLLDANMAQAIATAQNSRSLEDQQFRLPERFGIARDAAQHLLQLDPDDAKARTAIPILTINLWMANLAIPPTAAERALPVDRQPTESQRIDQAVAELTAAMRDHPENPDLPYWIAQAKIEQGVRLTRQMATDLAAGGADPTAPAGGDAGGGTGGGPSLGGDREADVRTLFGEAAVVFDDPIAHQPRNAQLCYRKFEVLTRLIQVDRAPEAVGQYQRQQRAALDAAQANVTPADGLLYAAYKSRWADYLAVSDPVAAEAVYKQLLDRPTTAPSAGAAAGADVQRLMEDVQVRLQYAQMLSHDPTRRADALHVLDAVPTVAPQGMPLSLQQPVARLLAQARLERAQVLTDQVEASGNPTTRAERAQAAQAEIDAVSANPRFAGEYGLLKARGRLQLVTGAYRDAIQTLGAAADKLAASGVGTDSQLLGWQADAFADGGQPGQAIRLLEQAVKSPPGANQFQPHLKLAQLYLDGQDYEHGRQQAMWLSERYPDDVRVIQVEIRALGRDADPKAVAELYARLPERTPAEQADKARWAVRTQNVADAERLMELVYAARPGDPGTALKLAELYNADGNKGRANQVLQQAMDAHPESRGTLQLVKDEVNGASQSAIEVEAERQIDAFKDPMTQEVARADLAAARNELAVQIDHLEKARAIQPDNRQVLNKLFLCYLSARAYDKAQGMVPHLADLDADEAHGLLFRFRLATARRDTATALAVGEQLTHDFPQFSSSWSSLGQAEQATGQLDAACAQYMAALDRQGNDPDVLQRLVDCLIRLGRLDDARRALADARRKYPDAGVYRRQLVQVEVAYGDPEAILPIVDEPVQSHPEVADNWQTAVQAYAAAAQRRTAKADGDGANRFTDRARQLLADALKRWPDSAGFAAELGDLQAHDGTEAGIAAAADTFHALAATPKWTNRPLPDVLLGRMYLQAKRPELAEAPLRHALELDPEATQARIALADSLFERHRPDAALDVLSPAKDQPQARAKYVDLLLALGRGPQAESELLADLKAHPDDPAPGNLLAHVYAAQGKFDAALDVANRTLEADPKDTAAYFVRGATEAGRPHPDLDAAAKDLSIFRTAYPDNLQGRVGLARVLEARHDVDGATRELEAAIDLAPDDKEARLLLAHDYLAVRPPRSLDADRDVAQALTVPQLAHDPDVQRAAAAVYLSEGKDDLAVTSIRDAMAHVADQRGLLDDYLNVLLATKHYDLLLAESAKFTADPKASWLLYDFRGRARAASGDAPGAMTEFATALDVAGTAPTLGPAEAVAAHVVEGLGIDSAVQLIGPRSENGANWKVVLATCYDRAGDRDKALATVQGAMPSIDTFAAEDRLDVTRLAATLYMTATPPQSERALPLFQEVLRGAPNDVSTLNNVACILAEQVSPPRPQEALTYSGRAFDDLRRAGRVDPYIFDTQGWLLILNGRVDDGIEVLRQVADGADFPDVHYHLAEGYLGKGSLSDARRELTTAATLYATAAASHRVVDPTLPAKVAAARAQADQMTGPPTPDKPQSPPSP
jgi:Tfp pilus assembly protein PilF